MFSISILPTKPLYIMIYYISHIAVSRQMSVNGLDRDAWPWAFAYFSTAYFGDLIQWVNLEAK